MPSIFDRRQATFNPNEIVQPPPSGGGIAPPPTGGHPSASSGGGASGLGFSPYIPPDQQAAWGERMQNLGLMYSLPAGGYLSTLNSWTGKPPTAADMDPNSAYSKFGPLNANSYNIKYGVADPQANARAAAFYGEMGALPTAPNLTPAASLLASQQPGGYQPQLGPSYNERLGHPWQGPWAF